MKSSTRFSFRRKAIFILIAIVVIQLVAIIGKPAYRRYKFNTSIKSCKSFPTRTDQKLRILVLGDSLTKGMFASSEEKTFKFLLADKLDADLASISSLNLPSIIEEWKSWNWEPDIVVVEIGLNDVSNLGGSSLPEDLWAENYGRFLDDLLCSDVRVVVCTMFQAMDSSHTDWEKYLRYNDYIRKEAEKRDIPITDLWVATEDCPECLSSPLIQSPFPPTFHGDNFHPSDYGHEIIAETIAEVILE